MKITSKGFTLMEVLVASLVSLLVLAGVYSFFEFGQRTYLNGADRRNMQHHLRLTSEKITNEIRYSASLELLADWNELPSEPSHVPSGVYYLFYDQTNNNIAVLSCDSYEYLTEAIISDVNFALEDDIFSFELEAQGRSGFYKLETTVLLLNALDPLSATDPIPALRYVKGRP